jgi:uncharacterized membrane protein
MEKSASQPTAPPNATVTRLELAISRILRAGILTSLVLVLTGVIVTLIRHPEFVSSTEALNYLKSEHYRFPTRLGDLFRGVFALQGRSIVLLGVFVLFLTPVVRVATSIVGYILEKDWPFVIITSVVLCLLGASLILGHAG